MDALIQNNFRGRWNDGCPLLEPGVKPNTSTVPLFCRFFDANGFIKLPRSPSIPSVEGCQKTDFASTRVHQREGTVLSQENKD